MPAFWITNRDDRDEIVFAETDKAAFIKWATSRCGALPCSEEICDCETSFEIIPCKEWDKYEADGAVPIEEYLKEGWVLNDDD